MRLACPGMVAGGGLSPTFLRGHRRHRHPVHGGGKVVSNSYQVKDHEVTPSELKEVIEQFSQTGFTDTPIHTSASTSCVRRCLLRFRPIENGLATASWRRKPFYDDNPSPGSHQTGVGRAAAQRRPGQITSISSSQGFLDVGHGDMHHDDRAIDHFIGLCCKHPEYADKVRAMVLPHSPRSCARSRLARETSSSGPRSRNFCGRGRRRNRRLRRKLRCGCRTGQARSLTHLPITRLIGRLTLTGQRGKCPRRRRGTNNSSPNSKHLRRKSWRSEKNALSGSVASALCLPASRLGAVFPTVGGWAFEIPQPPAKDAWRSDAPPASPYDLHEEILEGSPEGSDIVLGLNIRGDGRQDILKYIESTGNPPTDICVHVASVAGRAIHKRGRGGGCFRPGCPRASRPAP